MIGIGINSRHEGYKKNICDSPPSPHHHKTFHKISSSHFGYRTSGYDVPRQLHLIDMFLENGKEKKEKSSDI
jgi:hypothetical protein